MFNLTKTPSTNPDRLSVPVIDTASYTEAQLNAMPSELARRGRVSRLAAAMRSLHEETMRNYDAGVMDEQQQILHQEQQQGGVHEFNFCEDPSSSLSASPQQQLKFHAVGWKPKQQHQTSVSRLRNRTSGGAGVSSPSPATTFSRSRVVSQNDNQNKNNISFHGNSDQNDSSSKINNTNNSPIKTGTWASASRQRQEMQRIMLKQDVQKKKNDLVISQQRKGNRTMMTMTNQKNKNKDEEDQETDDDDVDDDGNDDDEEENNNSKKKKKTQGQQVEEFPGETEGEKFRNASVALRNINLKLKVMFEKRYRARIDDTNDGTENDPEEKRRRREAQNIVRREEAMEKKKQKRRQDLEANGYSKSEIEQLEKEGKLFGGVEMMNDTSVDGVDEGGVSGDMDEGGGGAAIGNAKMSMLLEQKEREATEATRQWKQSALDAELLSSELLRAQATIERYKLFMDETTQENERLRSEVETLKRELLMSKNRTQRILEDNQLRDDSLSRYGSLAVSKRGSLRNTTMSNAGSFASIGQKVISFTSNQNNHNGGGSPFSPSPQQPLDDNDVPVPVAAVKTTTATENIINRRNNNDDDLIPQIMTPTEQDISVPTPERGRGDEHDQRPHATTGDFVVANLGDGNKTDTKKETARGV